MRSERSSLPREWYSSQSLRRCSVADATVLNCGTRGPRRDRGEAETLRRFAEVEALVLRELVEPLRERAQVLLEQAAARVLEQPLHDRERLQLARREPEARQLVRVAGLGLAVLVAARVRVEDDGRVEMVLERGDRAMQRALRAFELRGQLLERNGRPARAERIACSWKMRSNLSTPAGSVYQDTPWRERSLGVPTGGVAKRGTPSGAGGVTAGRAPRRAIPR